MAPGAQTWPAADTGFACPLTDPLAHIVPNAYNVGMPGTLNIRRLADEVHAGLRLRAAHNSRSMEAEARDILARACAGEYDAAEGSSLARDACDSGLTVTLNPELAAAARDHAHRHHVTPEELISQLLDRELAGDATAWVDDLFTRMDQAGGNSGGTAWTRDELYRV